jgi:hypothetical protein
MIGVVSVEQDGELEEYHPAVVLSVPLGFLNLADQSGVHSVLLAMQLFPPAAF